MEHVSKWAEEHAVLQTLLAHPPGNGGELTVRHVQLHRDDAAADAHAAHAGLTRSGAKALSQNASIRRGAARAPGAVSNFQLATATARASDAAGASGGCQKRRVSDTEKGDGKCQSAAKRSDTRRDTRRSRTTTCGPPPSWTPLPWGGLLPLVQPRGTSPAMNTLALILLLAPAAPLPKPAVPAPLDCTGENGVHPADVKKAQEAWAKYLGRQVEEEDEIAPGVKMKFVLVPPGKYLMGSPPGRGGAGRRTRCSTR